jgi:hypothetical protein
VLVVVLVLVPVPVLVPVELALTVNVWELKPQCAPLPSAIKPVAASLGTVILSDVPLTLVMAASCPVPTHAAVMADNPDPDTVTTVPALPEVGEIEVMSGCAVLPAKALGSAPARVTNPAMACDLSPDFTVQQLQNVMYETGAGVTTFATAKSTHNSELHS